MNCVTKASADEPASNGASNAGGSVTAPASTASESSTGTRPKLVWRAVRPQRADGTSSQPKDAKEIAVQNAQYEQDVFDDGKAASSKMKARSTDENCSATDKLTKSESKTESKLEKKSTTKIVLTAGTSSADGDSPNDVFAADMPSVKTWRSASSANDEMDLVSPGKRETPPLGIDPEPVHRDPMELNPATPLRVGTPPRTMKTSQNNQATPTTPQPEPSVQPDLLPETEQRGGRPRRPEEDCHDEYIRVKNYTLNKLNINIKPPTEKNPQSPTVPYECALSSDPFVPRSWQCTTFTWKASALCHKPLYFEEVAMERYGHSHGPDCEYVTSFIHFFGNLALLPYWVGVDTPGECIYALGYYRPGNCAPYEFDAFPLSVRGACTGAVGYGGVIALFP